MTEPHVAGHSTHFLRRLDRFATPQVELALTLYRDPELLREVLRRARLAEQMERVAISLEDDHEGPFVVVTRDGRFVTCLGRGMRPSGLVVLTRAQLDAASARVDRMRERLEQARRLESELDGKTAPLLRKLSYAGPMLAREDFEAIARWEPLLGRQFSDMTIDCNSFVLKSYRTVVAIRERRRTSAEDELLEAFWYAFWARSHLLVLANVGDARGQAEELRAAARDPGLDPSYHLIVHANALGVVQHTVRALWATARHARDLLPEAKRQETPMLTFRAMRDLTLATIAHASSRSRAEAIKAIAVPDAEHPDGFERAWGELLRDHVLAPLAQGTARAIAAHRGRLESWLADYAFTRDEETIERGRLRSPDTYLASLGSCPMSWACNPSWLFEIADAIPWLTRCEASALFPSRAFCELQPWKYETQWGLALATGVRTAMGGGRPCTVRRPETPLRNDRCPCGSGAKYKRCCASAPPARAAVAQAA